MERDLKFLYQLVLSNIDKLGTQGSFGKIAGICDVIDDVFYNGLISEDEAISLRNHFNLNKPSETLHTEFFEHRLFVGGVYWWRDYYDFDAEVSNAQRKHFLYYLIQTL